MLTSEMIKWRNNCPKYESSIDSTVQEGDVIFFATNSYLYIDSVVKDIAYYHNEEGRVGSKHGISMIGYSVKRDLINNFKKYKMLENIKRSES